MSSAAEGMLQELERDKGRIAALNVEALGGKPEAFYLLFGTQVWILLADQSQCHRHDLLACRVPR